MVVFPHAKVNLGLQIISGPRDFIPGYHRIKTFMLVAGLNDILEVVPSDNTETHLFTSGIGIPPGKGNNLCLRAYELLRSELEDFTKKKLPPVDIYLHKCIPPGSGLGGGSSDAAFMLRTLNDMFRLNLPHERLLKLAALLGSDCGFFLHKESMISAGKGDILHPFSTSEIKGCELVIIIPPVNISTAWAYSKCSPKTPVTLLEDILAQPLDKWQDNLKNDFEPLIFEHYPICRKIKQHLIETGSSYASLSGSGSGVFGIYSVSPPLAQLRQLHPDCMIINTGIDVS